MSINRNDFVDTGVPAGPGVPWVGRDQPLLKFIVWHESCQSLWGVMTARLMTPMTWLCSASHECDTYNWFLIKRNWQRASHEDVFRVVRLNIRLNFFPRLLSRPRFFGWCAIPSVWKITSSKRKITPFWQICSTSGPYITQTKFLMLIWPSYDHINNSSLQL